MVEDQAICSSNDWRRESSSLEGTWSDQMGFSCHMHIDEDGLLARPFAELDWSSSVNGRAESRGRSSSAVRRTGLVQLVSTTHYRVPEGLLTVRELLRGRLCFWANFTPRRIRRAVVLHRSRFQPDLPTEEGSESNTDGFIPYVPQTKKASSKHRKDKQLMVDEDVVDGQLSPDNILKDYLDSQAGGSSSDQFNLEGLFEFDFPLTKGGPSKVLEFAKAGRMVSGGFLMINRALDTSKQEADMARFKPEVADKEISLLKDELESSRRREGESFEKEVNHAYRRGKREVVEVMKKRRDNFSQKFGEIKEHYKALADYRECRGTVGGLYLTQLLGYSYEGGYARQTVRLAEKDTNFAISEAEEKICEQWDPVPISPDTVEAETGDLGETGEVNQPVAPLDVNDYSIGRSVSGNFDLGD
ncbi:hypothetical protein HID58_091565 [Brassica napus]|uniref:Uncharacterized protein n=2 Tax=Brassica napus TaxID=3708 RepID=A0ABQ7X1V6_BRANA|nr:hypothetical protein HID58_091565 [Brassica napus]